jgi:predicted molibdopterin-dependent oxidoreductase YjgC
MSSRAQTPLWHRLVPRSGLTVRFTIDGVPAEACAGDLLITAILMQRPNLRRFEFGDAMRAGFCLMGACQDCWVGLADGRRVRACTTLVEEGMAVVVDAGDGR